MNIIKHISNQSVIIIICIFIFSIYKLEINLFGHKLFPSGFLIQNFLVVFFGYIAAQILSKSINSKIVINYFFCQFFFPILFSFLLFTPLIFFFYLPNDFFVFLKTLFFSGTFLSNYYIWFRSDLNPEYFIFQNTWILSIIFQLVLCYIFINKYTKSLKLNLKLFILFSIFLISLSISNFININASGFNFFFFISHLWEFILGALIYNIKKIYKIKNLKLQFILLILTFFIILFTLNGNYSLERTPSFNTLIPVLIFCALLYFAERSFFFKHKNFKIFLLLNSSLIIFILFSPIYTFTKTTILFDGKFYKLFSLSLVLLLSLIFSYFILKKRKILIKKFFYLILICSAIIIPLSIVKSKEKLPDIFVSEETKKPWLELKNEYGMPCFYSNSKVENFKEYCSIENNSKYNLIITGRSYMASIQSDLFNKLKGSDLNFFSLIGNDCKYLSEMKKSIIICHIQNFNSKHQIKEKFIEIDKMLKDNSVILIMPFPTPGGNLPKKLYARMKLKNYNSNKDFPSKEIILKNNFENHEKILNKIKKYYKKNNKLYIYNTHNNFCDNNYCYTYDKNGLFYLDEGHPTKYILNNISDDIKKLINSILNDFKQR